MDELEPELGHAVNMGMSMKLGNILVNVPKKVCGVSQFDQTGDVVYLCSWEQASLQSNTYFMPNWVQAHILRRLKKE